MCKSVVHLYPWSVSVITSISIYTLSGFHALIQFDLHSFDQKDSQFREKFIVTPKKRFNYYKLEFFAIIISLSLFIYRSFYLPESKP